MKKMAGKSLNFELDDGDSVTMTLTNSARISLTDITAATIGNLTEDSQWEDNSVTDTGAAVLRPWEDNSNSDKSDMIAPIAVYENRQPPSYKEHLKRRLNSDDNEDAQAGTKRIKIQSSDNVKDVTTFQDALVATHDSSLYNLHDTSHVTNIQGPGYNTPHTVVPTQNYPRDFITQHSQQDDNSQSNMLGRSLYSSLIDISSKNSMPTLSTQNSMPTLTTQNLMPTLSTQNALPTLTTQNSLQTLSSQNSTQRQPTTSSMPSLSSRTSVQSSSWQDMLPSLSNHYAMQSVPTQNTLPSLPTLIPVQSLSTQNSLQSSATQNSVLSLPSLISMQSLPSQNTMQSSYLQDSLPSVSTQNSKINSMNNNQIPSSTVQNSQQSVSNKNLVLYNQHINSVSQASNINYLPWKNTLPLKENKNFENVKADDRIRQQTTVDSSNFITADSTTSLNQIQYPFKPEPRQIVPTQSYYISSLQATPDYWQTSSSSSQQRTKPQASETGMIPPQPADGNTQHLQAPVPLYLQLSDILQTKVDTSQEYTPMEPSWQQTLSSLQTNDSYPNQSSNIKQEPATPIGKGQMVNPSYDSPGFDSRFTESLSNLLGSPPPDSPLSKNPILGDLQALLNRECKREIVPQSLFSIQNTNKNNTEKKPLNVFERERNLQERFTKLQSCHSEDIRQLSSMFRYQSALIETERFRTLHECQYPGSYKESVNHHYDNQLHKVMDRVERSVELLENSNKENKANKVPKMRPHLNKEAIRLMEHWYRQNLDHPYPTSSSIEMLAHAGNIGIEQVKKWFANKRNRNSNTRSLTEIAMQKRKLGQMTGQS